MEAQTELIAGQKVLRLPSIRVVVVNGPDRGAEVTARTGRLKIGTAKDNDLVLTDPAVSRHHMTIALGPSATRVRDLDSRNGTHVDGVTVFDAQLAPGSRVSLGQTTLQVTPVDEPVSIPLSSSEQCGRLIGRSVAMRQVFAIIERVAPSEATVLIRGETGTGKELTAEALHQLSERSEGPFLTLDCGAIAASLLESELFGHSKGAFTGAHGDRAGVFEAAHRGTLFLDEIGELPLELQPKLLRVLEGREVRRVGENHTRSVDVRILAATHRDLASLVNTGQFREDLYYRLAVVELELPALRHRVDDIPMLVRHIAKGLDGPVPSSSTLASLQRKAWPGNVRELRNAVERALALAHGQDSAERSAVAEPDGLLQSLLRKPYHEAMETWTATFERAYVLEILRRTGGSVTEAAKIAGVTRRHIQRVLKRHQLRGNS
ncbi:MAG: transcriptional regulator with GAF, ATPase, and Fis domain [Polyangiales bacterium]|jgi:transcriptional regulator with GAF, ATPase, and Fis domain